MRCGRARRKPRRRRRVGIASTPRCQCVLASIPHTPAASELEERRPSLSGDAVHDLELAGLAGDRSQQPVTPALGLLVVPRAEECEQAEGRVAQPAVAIVPVALAADLLGKAVVAAPPTRRSACTSAPSTPSKDDLTSSTHLSDTCTGPTMIATTVQPSRRCAGSPLGSNGM